MKRTVLTLLLMLVATASHAGMTYDFRSETTGSASSSLAGKVEVEKQNLRMAITRGDGMIFQDGSIVISRDGGKTLSVADPSAKTYFDLEAENLLGGAGAFLRQFGELVKFEVKNPVVTARDGGDGGTIEGFPTKKQIVDSSYDVLVDVFGSKMTIRFESRTEAWTTSRMSADMMTFVQMRGFRTGIEQIDRLIATQANALKGFPLKQVTTVNVIQGAKRQRSTTTATVSNIRAVNVAPAQFTLPRGYTKVASPFERMLAR